MDTKYKDLRLVQKFALVAANVKPLLMSFIKPSVPFITPEDFVIADTLRFTRGGYWEPYVADILKGSAHIRFKMNGDKFFSVAKDDVFAKDYAIR